MEKFRNLNIFILNITCYNLIGDGNERLFKNKKDI